MEKFKRKWWMKNIEKKCVSSLGGLVMYSYDVRIVYKIYLLFKGDNHERSIFKTDKSQ